MVSDPGTPPEEPTNGGLPRWEEQPPTPKSRPTWMTFLTPGAIVVGAIIVAAAVFITRGGDDDDEPPPPPATVFAAIERYAEETGMDMEAFQECVLRDDVAETVQGQLMRGAELGVNGTPTFFVNNKMIVGAQPASVFDEVIRLELEGSPTSLEVYSEPIQQLAAASPSRFAIVDETPDLTGAQFEGSPDAPVIIAEFSDFQCPFCQRWTTQTLPGLRDQLGDEVAMAFLHFPLVDIHPNAGRAHIAAECAAEQGRFWPMHDLLFERQTEWQDLPAR